MDLLVVFITFMAVNLDFFFILLFLLERYKTRDVAIGYMLGVIFLMAISYMVGKVLNLFLPEWALGILGFLPIYMALHDQDEEPAEKQGQAPIIATFITYLAVCSGCNLSLFLPILTGQPVRNFFLAVRLVVILALAMVYLIQHFGRLVMVKNLMNKYGEKLMKVVYIGVGLYVFYDSGLINQLIRML